MPTTLHGLFGYFLGYFNDKKRYQPIPNNSTEIRLSLQNQFFQETSIEGEAQEHIGAWIPMVSSSYYIGFLIN